MAGLESGWIVEGRRPPPGRMLHRGKALRCSVVLRTKTSLQPHQAALSAFLKSDALFVSPAPRMTASTGRTSAKRLPAERRLRGD